MTPPNALTRFKLPKHFLQHLNQNQLLQKIKNKENPIGKTVKKRNGSSTVPKQRIPFNEVVANVSMIWGYNLGL